MIASELTEFYSLFLSGMGIGAVLYSFCWVFGYAVRGLVGIFHPPR